MPKLIFKYAFILFTALACLKFLQYQFFSYKLNLEVYLGIIAAVFLIAGIVISQYWNRLEHNNSLTSSRGKEDSFQNESSSIDIEKLQQFSDREQQVLSLLCHGYTNKEIAKSLGISPNTVKTHLGKLFFKLGVNNRTQALSEAKLLNMIR